MKRILSITTLLTFAATASAQSPSTNQNYVMETTVKVPGKTTTASLVGLPVGQANRTIQYFDGLGRPLQTVTWQGSPSGKDMVQVFEYDALGREVKKYLPYAEQSAADGAYKPSGISSQGLFYQPGGGWDGNTVKTGYPYSMAIFEPSPLNRVERQGFPGAAWQPGTVGTERTARQSYGTNNGDTNHGTTGYAVRLFRVSGGSLSSSGFYGVGQLYLTTSKDENWQAGDGKKGMVEEYRDKEGRIVLKRMFNEKAGNIEVLSTYYVYDDLGNLSFVLPPGADPDAGVPNGTALDNYCYQYRYDGWRRLIEKKLPGKGWEHMVYNRLDQMVLSRDPNLAQQGKWLFSKYDAHGRTVMTGMLSNSAGRADMQAIIDAESDGVAPDYPLWESRATGSDYTGQAYPRSYDHQMTVDYYDDYSFPSYHSAFGFVPFGPYADKSTMTRGLKTGARVRNLSTGEMMLSVTYYDGYGRAVQVHSENHLGGLTAASQGIDRVDTEYDFDGSIKKIDRSHRAYGATTNVATIYTYDHMGRSRTTSQGINGAAPTILSELEYNEIGQLRTKKLHNGLQATSYAYNERGWLTGSSSPQFSMSLQYNDGTYPQYNGNISGQGYTNSGSNAFTYQYDRLNRLINGTATGMSEIISYDVMGNIGTLKRDGSGHNQYYYNGNRLHAVDDIAYAYSYDANGNATIDGRTGVALAYNHLNLPITASRSGLSMAYTYDATGAKLKKISTGTSTTTTDYVDGIQYTNGTIDFIQTGEGIARNNGGVYSYEYNLSDHLGNVRASFDIYGGAVRILQRDDYYAFGLRKTAVGGTNKYLYNGKELQEELEQYDYGARFYDPVIGRWIVMDPLAEKFYSVNPYNFTDNNPVNNIDPDGMATYYGAEAQEMFAQIQASYGGAGVNCPDKPCDGKCGVSMSNELSFIGQDLSKAINDLPGKLLTFTDVNDATVLVTTVTRGSKAINSDDTPATTVDKVSAAVGILIPFVSGSGVKNVLKKIGENFYGTYASLRKEGLKDAHHIIQDAAVRDLPGYKSADAPALHLEGPSTKTGTPHNLATVVQRQRRALGDGGTYRSEMNIAYRALRAAGLSPANAKEAIKLSNVFFGKLNVTPSTPTRFPYTRK